MRFRGRRQQCVPAERVDASTGAETDPSTIKSETREKCAELQRGIEVGPNTPKQPLNVEKLPLNQGWHQYAIPDIGQAVKIRYPSVNGDAELRLDANEFLKVAGNTLQMQRLDGRVVISARKELAGMRFTVEADGYERRSVEVRKEMESAEPKRESQQGKQERKEATEKQTGVLYIDKVGDREFLIPKENAPLFIRYDQANNQGSMVGWYDMQPGVVRSEHGHFIVDGRDGEGRDQPFLRLNIKPDFTGDIQLWRNNRQEVIHVTPKGADVKDQSREHTLERTRDQVACLKRMSPEAALQMEKALGYDRSKHDGRAQNDVLEEALKMENQVKSLEKGLRDQEDKLKKTQASLGSAAAGSQLKEVDQL